MNSNKNLLSNLVIYSTFSKALIFFEELNTFTLKQPMANEKE